MPINIKSEVYAFMAKYPDIGINRFTGTFCKEC